MNHKIYLAAQLALSLFLGSAFIQAQMNMENGRTPWVNFRSQISPSFLAPIIAPTHVYPANLSSVQVVDLNNDNAPEIVGLDGTDVAVLRNQGNGTYAGPVYYSVFGQPNDLAVGDFNGDGNLDVAVAIGASTDARGKVAVFLNKGDGTLKAPVYYTVPLPANSIAVADLNNDNKRDIAVVGNSSDHSVSTVAILLNTGTSFTVNSFPATTYFTSNGWGPNADSVSMIVAGDFNGDGRIDLAYDDSCAQCDISLDYIYILANTTSGWKPYQPTSTSGLFSLAAADIDGDGITDFVFPYAGCHTPCDGVSVVFMKKDFTVGGGQELNMLSDSDAPLPSQLVIGDLNNDGIADIAGYSDGGWDQQGNAVPPGIMIWTGAGNRTFNNLKYYNQPNPPSAQSAYYIAAGFLNKDGTRDLVVPWGSDAQLWMNSTSTKTDPCSYPTSGGIHVCSPTTNVATGTVHFLASARTNTQPLLRMELWLDNKKKAQVFTDRLHIDLAVPKGIHTAGFVEVGANGVVIKKNVVFTAK